MSQLGTANEEYLDVDSEVETAQASTTMPTTMNAADVTAANVAAEVVDLPEPISVSPVEATQQGEDPHYADESISADFVVVDINNNNIDSGENNSNNSNIVSNNNNSYDNNVANTANGYTNGFQDSFSATEVLSTQPSNGDLVVCNQALANLCVYQFVPVNDLEQSHSPNNNNNNNNSISSSSNNLVNFNSSHNNFNNHNNNNNISSSSNHQHVRSGHTRASSRHGRHRGRRSHRDKQALRRSLKSMNNFLRKTVTTLRRIKSLILQQVQIARALHLGSQLTMW